MDPAPRVLAFVSLLCICVSLLRVDIAASTRTAAFNPSPFASVTRDFNGALFYTLGSDFFIQEDGTTYVRTGDIPAMWLRDSAAQALPYIRFMPDYPALQSLLLGVIQRNARNVLVDPYANVFTDDYRVWERKWEVDSLSYPVWLAAAYWHRLHDRTLFSNEW